MEGEAGNLLAVRNKELAIKRKTHLMVSCPTESKPKPLVLSTVEGLTRFFTLWYFYPVVDDDQVPLMKSPILHSMFD